jgi:two-component system osmolarity sensor histidine kinase EnvZ
MFKILKKILPHSLFRRFLLIILLPNIIVQLVSVYVFYERHWSGMSKYMASSLARQVDMVVKGFSRTTGKDREDFISITKNSLDLQIQFVPYSTIRKSNILEQAGFSALLSSIDLKLQQKEHSISFDAQNETVVIEVMMEGGVLQIIAPRRSIYTPTTYIFILWMTGTAILFVLIAILFMRSQVRSITKLAEVAEKFGRGQDMPGFKPSGAMEVRQASQAFIEMRTRINRQVEQRTEMLAGVSHDLKTPLTRMKLQLALMEVTPEIEELQQDIAEMEKMVQEYLDFAKGKERVIDRDVGLSDMLRSIVSGYRNLNKKIDVTAQSGIALHINANALRRAITNIVDNALKYGKIVQISANGSEKYAYINVDDDGPGIPDKKKNDVFQPFFRLDNARNLDKGGTGLGLAIAKDIIASYGGDIILENSHMGGLRVKIKLPL